LLCERRAELYLLASKHESQGPFISPYAVLKLRDRSANEGRTVTLSALIFEKFLESSARQNANRTRLELMPLVRTDLICSNQSHPFDPCSVQRTISTPLLK